MFLVVWFVLETDVKQCGQEGEERLGWGRVRGGGWEWVVEWGERGDKIDPSSALGMPQIAVLTPHNRPLEAEGRSVREAQGTPLVASVKPP